MQDFLEAQKQFNDLWYVRITKALPETESRSLCEYAIQRSQTATMSADARVPGSPAAYGDPRMERLLLALLPLVEDITKLKLYPTYSYFRVYKRGDVLGRHTDRSACEISVSVALGKLGAERWPLWIEGPAGPVDIEMEPGDITIYRGVACPHWRESFRGESAAQAFLHYVDQTGPYARWKFDKRRRIGTVPHGPIEITNTLREPQVEQRTLPVYSGHLMRDEVKMTIWRGLENHCSLPSIIEDVVKKCGLSQPEAEVTVMEYVYDCERRGMLFIHAS